MDNSLKFLMRSSIKVQFRTEFELNKSFIAFDRSNRLIKVVLIQEINKEELERLFSIFIQVVCIYKYNKLLVDLRFLEHFSLEAELLFKLRLMEERTTIEETLNKIAIFNSDHALGTFFSTNLTKSVNGLSTAVESKVFNDPHKAFSWLLDCERVHIL